LSSENPTLRPSVPQSLTSFEAEIVAVFADLVVLLGLPRSMGEIYGLVFASAEPPTFADIEQKLCLSKGSVSQGLRALRELGAVREADRQSERGQSDSGLNGRVPRGVQANDSSGAGQRAVHWEATTELRQLIGTLLRERLTPYLGRQDQRMEAAEAALEAEAARLPVKNYKALKSKLDKLQTWQSRARTVLPVIGKML
jgi:DNA-binding transcriptional ArsR family regulator